MESNSTTKWAIVLATLAIAGATVIVAAFWSQGDIPFPGEGGPSDVSTEGDAVDYGAAAPRETATQSESEIQSTEALDTEEWRLFESPYGYKVSYPSYLRAVGNADSKVQGDPVGYTTFYESIFLSIDHRSPSPVIGFLVNDTYGHGTDSLGYARAFWREDSVEQSLQDVEPQYEEVLLGNHAGTRLTYEFGGVEHIRIFVPISSERYGDKYVLIAYSTEYEVENQLATRVLETISFQQ